MAQIEPAPRFRIEYEVFILQNTPKMPPVHKIVIKYQLEAAQFHKVKKKWEGVRNQSTLKKVRK